MKVHKLTNNTIIYPNYHIWHTDNSKLNILSNTVVEKEDFVLINRTTFKLVECSAPKRVSDMELIGTNNISEHTRFYECIVEKVRI